MNKYSNYTRINNIDQDWKNIKNKCRTTVNKQYTENIPGDNFKYNLMIAEHTPIRLLNVDWSWEDIPYWVAMEFARHKFEKFISTQRTDRTGVDRSQKPQDAPVKMDCYANSQNIIDFSRKRLCKQASLDCQLLTKDLKLKIYDISPELSLSMVPNCVYRCGCPEQYIGQKCTFFEKFKKECQEKDKDIFDIKDRYQVYMDMVISEI